MAQIKSIDISEASKSKGVQAVITGDYIPVLCGPVLEDRPPIAKDKVRYYGEPVAMVVANSEQEAMNAAKLIKVEYEPLTVVNSIQDTLKPDAVIIHEQLSKYKHVVNDVYPEANTNISDRSACHGNT